MESAGFFFLPVKEVKRERLPSIRPSPTTLRKGRTATVLGGGLRKIAGDIDLSSGVQLINPVQGGLGFDRLTTDEKYKR
jgi:hypothetical protein